MRLGLANLVDVTGEVEHLVGEAPLIRDRSALSGKAAERCSDSICFDPEATPPS